MGRLYIMLRHDLVGLGKKGQIVTKSAFDAFVREQNDGLKQFILSRKDDENGEDRGG
jgi:hypothetical protein